MTRQPDRETGLVRLGQFAGPHGIRGWVKVRSDTDPPEAILDYRPWLVGEDARAMMVADSVDSGGSLRVLLAGVSDRDGAAALSGMDIAVPREQLPDLPAGRYYWADLEGCLVATVDDRELGEVVELMETGANDVLRVRGGRERLIPFVMGRYVRSVDLDARRIVVDWDPEF